MSDIIKINDNVKLHTSGDLDNLPNDSFLYEKSFISYNSNYFKEGFNKNINVFSELLSSLPGIERIRQNLDTTLNFEVVISNDAMKALKDKTASFLNSKKGKDLLAPLIKIKGKKGISHQIALKQGDLSKVQLDNILSTSQMLTIQKSLSEISSQIENLDRKLSDVLLGLNNDRIAHIQSGYNLFLQANASENLKDSLYKIALGQLSLGREQLIYSLKGDINEFQGKESGIYAMFEQIRNGRDDINKEQLLKINRIKQSLSFILRSTQLMAVIYQHFDEKYSMMQSVIRLNDVLSIFNEELEDKFIEWSNDEKNISEFINQTKTLKHQIKFKVESIIENPKEFKLDINITDEEKK
jgi:hypothetical protein